MYMLKCFQSYLLLIVWISLHHTTKVVWPLFTWVKEPSFRLYQTKNLPAFCFVWYLKGCHDYLWIMPIKPTNEWTNKLPLDFWAICWSSKIVLHCNNHSFGQKSQQYPEGISLKQVPTKPGTMWKSEDHVCFKPKKLINSIHLYPAFLSGGNLKWLTMFSSPPSCEVV